MRRRFALPLAVMVMPALALAACGSDADSGRRALTQLDRGVAIEVGGVTEAVDSATVLAPYERSWYAALRPQVEADGLVVARLGEDGFGVVIAYAAGPDCGLLPEVLIDGDEAALRIGIVARLEGDCDDVGWDEAIGLDLAPAYEHAEVTATYNGLTSGLTP